ncbi:hypothetical protein LTR28_012576 [Elasticomyces elasticus]|nr:hypothetical protein LTR28_012576 [Elasticomyces elasticus]
MALNAASHNTPGEKTGPVTGPPPPVSNEATDAILGAAEKDTEGQSSPGRDGGGEGNVGEVRGKEMGMAAEEEGRRREGEEG